MNVDWAPQFPELIRAVAALRGLRYEGGASEYEIHGQIEAALKSAGIAFEREVKLGARRRIDFLTAGGIGIEVKKGKAASGAVAEQVDRYGESERVKAVVLVVERSVFRAPEETSGGKPVVYLSLSKLMGPEDKERAMGMKRPVMNEEMKLEAARRIAGLIADEGNITLDDQTREEWVADAAGDIAEAMEEWRTDGFAIAQELDRRGWSIDAGLVALLDQSGDECDEILRHCVKKWVKDCGIEPAFAIGVRAAFEDKSVHPAVRRVGEITKIYVDQAQYCIRVPELGHVKERPLGASTATLGRIVNYEDVSAVGEGE